MTTENDIRANIERLEAELEWLLSDVQIETDTFTDKEIAAAKERSRREAAIRDWKPTAAILPRAHKNLGGVTDKSYELVKQALEAGQRHFGVPAANIADSDFVNTKDRAGVAEALTSQHILNWIESRQLDNVALIDSVNVPGLHDDKDTDHALIAGSTVVLIDSKAFTPGYYYKLQDRGGNFGGGAKILKQAIIPGEAIADRRGYAEHCYLSTDALLGIWRRYLIAEANIFGMVYINSDNIRVERNREWFDCPFPVVSRESIYTYLDRLYEHVKREKNEAGENIGTMLNAELIAQVVVAATHGVGVDNEAIIEAAAANADSESKLTSIAKTAREENNNYFISHHYHYSQDAWTVYKCSGDGCERRSFKLNEAIRAIHYLGEKTYGIGDDMWFKRNQYVTNEDGSAAGGATGSRGKWRFNVLSDLTTHLDTGRLGEENYKWRLNSMLQWNKNFTQEHFDQAVEYLGTRNKNLKKQYEDKDQLSPELGSGLPHMALNRMSKLYVGWTDTLTEITESSVEKLTAEGEKWKVYEETRSNRNETEDRKKNEKAR